MSIDTDQAHKAATTGRQAGRIALVTGGSRGIGRAISERLAADGAVVAVHYGTNEQAAVDVVAGIRANGGDAFAIGGPLGERGDAARIFERLDGELIARSGGPAFDILVNNAGIAGPSSLGDTDEAWFDELFAVNARAPFFLTRLARDRLRDNGRVITISTGLTRHAEPPLAAYAMSKAAVDVMTMTLAKELGPRGITVNCVAPGVIDTDMNAGWLRGSAEAKRSVASMSPFNRGGEPGDVADVVAFLASTDARFVTGQYLDATGGALL